MNIAVTGAAGFIGSNLVHSLNSFGFNNLILVDKMSMFSKTWEYSLKNVKYSHIFEPYEYLDYLSNIENHPQFTFHIGAISDTMGYSSEAYFKYNYKYSKVLLDKFISYLSTTLDPKGYFINASSSAVYGNMNGPLNAYAMCKQLIDDYILHNIGLFKGRIASCRFFNVYGYGEFHKNKMASMIYQLICEVLTSNKFTIFEPGDQCRDFIYVKDLVYNLLNIFPLVPRTSLKILDKPLSLIQLENPIIDFGSGSSYTFNDVVEMIRKVSHSKTAKLNYIPMPKHISERYQVLTNSIPHPEYKLKITYPLSRGICEYFSIISQYHDKINK